eukprot:Skav224073  [mRNA]  locus=scaffold942:23534:26989:+ [translate_table: standard]
MTLKNVRGIMMLSTLGKLYHGVVRRCLTPFAETMRAPTQLGGFKGQQTAYGSLALRAYVKAATARACSVVTLFVDVKHAFHALLRQHAFSGADTFPPKLRAILTAEGLNVDELLADAPLHAQRFQTVVPPQTARVMEDAHRCTWFTMQGDDEDPALLFETQRGSRPGSPLADMAFNVLMSSVLADVHQMLVDDAAVQQASMRIDLAPIVVAWADDVALPIPCPSALEVKPVLTRLVPTLTALLGSYGLCVNFQPGKTEAVVSLRGVHSQLVQRELLFEDYAHLQITPTIGLRLVSTYQHLGARFAQALSIRAEVHHRLDLARGAFSQMVRPIFRSKRLSVAIRLRLFEALVVPIALYGCGTWPLLSASLYKKIEATLVGWQRSIASVGYWSASKVTDDAFRAQHQLPALSLRLAKHRILLALQMQRSAPSTLFDLLSAEDCSGQDTWLQALRHSLRWYVHEAGPDHFLYGKELTAEAIFAWLAQTTHLEAHAVRRQVKRRLLEEATIHDVASHYRQMFEVCAEHGVTLSEPLANEEGVAGSYVCNICHATFASIQGLCSHRWKRHQIRSKERSFMTSTTCNACQKCFWTSQRLQQHLKRSQQYENGCYFVLKKYMDPVDPGLTEALNEVPPQLAHIHRLPAHDAEGPSALPTSTAWERNHAAHRDSLDRQWRHFDLPAELPPDVLGRLSAAFDAGTLNFAHQFSGTELDDDALAIVWMEIVDMEPNPDLGVWALIRWGQTRRYELMDELVDVDLVAYIDAQFFVAVADFPMWSLLNAYERLSHSRPPADSAVVDVPTEADRRAVRLREPFPDRFLQQQAFLAPWTTRAIVDCPVQPQVPLVVFPDGSYHLLVLHLYSGRRREEDCHFWAAELGKTLFRSYDIEVHVLSLDTAISQESGDMLGSGFRHALALCRLGAIALTLSGPPCETWTAARHLPCEDHPRPPRPLRSRERAWGLLQRTVAELKQLKVGSALLCRGIMVELFTVLWGGGALMEHPAPPLQPEFASTWSTSMQVSIMGKLPDARSCTFGQYRYGAASVKPTTFRTAGLPGFNAAFLREQQDFERPSAQLGGWDIYQKRYRTAAAKEYPPLLCRAMVVGCFTSLDGRLTRNGPRLIRRECIAESELRWIHNLEQAAQEYSHEFRQDYQPRTD